MRYLVIILFLSTVLSAQDRAECRKKVVVAENQFGQGLYKEAELSVRSALNNCKLSRRGKLDAYEILTRVKIETDDLDEAYANLKKVIKLNPNYQPNAAKLEEDYIKYFNKYKVLPVLTAGLYSEILFPHFYSVGAPNTILGEYDYSAKYSPEKTSSQIGLTIGFGLPTNTRFSFDPGFTTLHYGREIMHRSITGFTTKLQETDKYLCLPIEIDQHKRFKRFTVYAGAGYRLYKLQTASAVIVSNYPKLDYDTSNYVDLVQKNNISFTEYASHDMKPYRQDLRYVNLNTGATFSMYGIILDLKLSFNHALKLMNSKDYYLPANMTFKNYYVDNSFYFHFTSLRLSASYTLGYKIIRVNKE
jgi:hypothetical protein